MKAYNAKHHWIVDAVLLIGFIATFWMDLTGLTLHQWLGVLVGVLVGYHVLLHWNWVKRTVGTLFKRWCAQPFAYLLLDTALGFNFTVMMVTGIVLSTWLNLELTFYDVWRETHILSSIGALVLLVLKLVLHWRWIVCVMERYIWPKRPTPKTQTIPTVDFARREFLGVMGLVGAGVGLSLLNAGKALLVSSDTPEHTVAAMNNATTPAQATLTPRAATPTVTPSPTSGAKMGNTLTSAPTVTPQPTATPIPTATPTPTQTCIVRCPRGCLYPGRCRKYTDRNNNGRCDWGECL